MNRRTFNEMMGLGALGSFARPHAVRAVQNSSGEAPTEPPRWPDQIFRRSLVDMHIPDWDPRLLSKFDTEDYARTIAEAGFQSMTAYANSHVGLCYWRTDIGQRHRNMKDRDFFGEIVQQGKQRGLPVLAYYSVVFDNWAYEYHPDWRLIADEDSLPTHPQRYGFACPNSPYKDHVLACLRELVGRYEFQGILIDMVFWPDVCYCPHCIARFREEAGVEPPRTVDWDDPTWRKFQAARQRWMLEFAKAMTGAIKQTRPITVVDNFAPSFSNWRSASPLELRDAMDYVTGDFYGGPAQHSLVCKTFAGLTPHRPFEFATSRTRDLRDHATTKPFAEIQQESALAALHSAAFLMIDAINLDGSLNHDTYKFLARLNQKRAAYDGYYGGELRADIAIYYDQESVYNPAEQKIRVGKLRALDQCPHRDAVVGFARILRESHMPFGVVTNANLEQLAKYRAVLLPNVLEMTAGQAAQFRKFVETGGMLYASSNSSLDRFDKKGPRFLLEDVLGVRYAGTVGGQLAAVGGSEEGFSGETTPEAWRTSWSYLSPVGDEIHKLIWPQKELSYPGPMLKATALPGTEVLATITLPFAPPAQGRPIGSRFGAIHSNPPALLPGTDPGIVCNRFGKGQALWVAAPVENSSEAVNMRLLAALIKHALPGPYCFEAETHPSVEMTIFDQPEKKRLLASLVSTQDQFPPFAATATVRVRVPKAKKVSAVRRVPQREPLQFKMVDEYVQFDVAPFTAFSMNVIEYE